MDQGADRQAALATLIHLVLGGRPKGVLTRDIPQLFQRFRTLAPFARIAYAERAGAPELRGRLASELARWLPNDPAELRRRELPAEPDVRALIENVLGGERMTSERARKVPQSWDDPDPDHRVSRSKEWATEALRHAADLIAHRLLVEDADRAGPRQDADRVGPRPRRVATRPSTWWLPAFDELARRSDSLAVLQAWLDGDSPLLVLDGLPGAGKSSLLISLLRSLTGRDGTPLGEVQVVSAILREPHKPDVFDMQGLLRAIVDAGIAAGVDPDLLPPGFGGLSLAGPALLPAAEFVIAQRSPDSPALIVVDGIDQIEDVGHEDVIDVLGALVRQAPGTGYRFVLSSRRTLPPGIDTNSAVRFRLDAEADAAVLEAVVAALLEPLHAEDRERTRDLLVNGSEGSWLWACLNARWIAREFAGRRITGQLELSHGLQGLWSDAMSSVARRLGTDSFNLAMRPLLACLAVASTGRLGRDELRWATGLGGERIADLARQCEPYVAREGAQEFRLCHPDLGRWVLGDQRWGYAEADAHLMLADGLVQLGQESGWRENTATYAARFVLDHYIGGLSLDPFRPDRTDKIARLLAVLLDQRFVDRVPHALDLFVQLSKLSLVVPDLNLPRTQLPLAGVLGYVMMHPTVIFVAGVPLALEFTDAELDEVESVIRSGGTLLQMTERMFTVHADLLARPGKAVWAALIAGLIDVRVTGAGLLDVRLDLDFVRRRLIERGNDGPSLTLALCGATLRLADAEPEVLGPHLADLVHHHDRVGLPDRMLPDLLSLLSYHRFPADTQGELVAFIEGELARSDHYDRDGQTTLTQALSNALWELPAQQRADALPRHVEVARRMLELAGDREPDAAVGTLFEQRHLARLEVRAQELLPPEERDPATVRRLVELTRAMRVSAPLGDQRRQYLLYDTVRALELVAAPGLAELDELVAVQREICQLELLEAPHERVDTEHGLAESLRRRYLLRPAEARDAGELREALTAIRRALADAGPAPALPLPYTLCEIAALLLEHDRSAELAEELRATSAELLAGAQLSDPERAELTAARDKAEARLAELRAEQDARARRDVDALRAAVAAATDENRLTRTLDLINSIEIEHEQPAELLREKLGLLDRLLAEHPATASRLGHQVARVRALTLIALGDRAGGLAALFATEHPSLSVADRLWLGWRLYRELEAADGTADWVALGGLARRTVEAAEPGDDAALSALDLLVRSYYFAVRAANRDGDARLPDLLEPGYEAARALDDALEARRPGLLDATRANALHNFAYLVAVHRLVPGASYRYEGAAVARLEDLFERLAAVFEPAPIPSQTHFGLFLFMSEVYRDFATAASHGSTQHEAAARQAVRFVRAAVAYAPPGAQPEAKRRLVTALNALPSMTRDELDELIELGLETLRSDGCPDEAWPYQAQVTLRAMRTRRRWDPVEYMSSPDRETTLPIYRRLVGRLDPGSPAWVDTMDDFSYALDDPRRTVAELDEEIEARRLVLPHLDEMGWRSPWSWHANLGGSLLVRAMLGSDASARLADLQEARALLDHALGRSESAAAKVHYACTRASVLTRLVAEGALPGPEAIRESVGLLGAVLVDLPAEDVPITRLRQLPLTIVREMRLQGVWPAGLDAPLVPRSRPDPAARGDEAV
ncbi:MAG TPA: hypothetical protein VMB79_06865 [Jatrophihabitans sp.]|nr:hypothetical protein [Jatrophihabitans sp.]